jgi:hypothetical protein
MEKLLVDLWGASISVEGDVWGLGAAIIIVGIVAVAAVVAYRPRRDRTIALHEVIRGHEKNRAGQ